MLCSKVNPLRTGCRGSKSLTLSVSMPPSPCVPVAIFVFKYVYVKFRNSMCTCTSTHLQVSHKLPLNLVNWISVLFFLFFDIAS